MSDTQEFLGTGRRKSAVARVRVSHGTGKFTINGRGKEEYFPVENIRNEIELPLQTIDAINKYDIRVRVTGGGTSGQAGAVRHGLSRALLNVNAEFRPALKAEGFLTRDPRAKERKKYGQPGARKRFQYSKR
jgi:small subunit ribosomal protein S9